MDININIRKLIFLILCLFYQFVSCWNILALNQISNPHFTTNDSGWIRLTPVQRPNPMSFMGYRNFTGYPSAGCYLASATSTSNNYQRDGLIEQTFTVTGGNAYGRGRFAYRPVGIGAYDTLTLACRLHIQDSTPNNPNDNLVYTHFNQTWNNGAALPNTWQLQDWSVPVLLSSGTTYVWRVYWDTQNDNNEQCGAYVDYLDFVISPTGLKVTYDQDGNIVLVWNQSTGASVLNYYKIYYKTNQSGPYYHMANSTTNSYVVTNPPYSPTGVIYFAVSDVDTTGIESPQSVEAMAFGINVRVSLIGPVTETFYDDIVEINWDHPNAPLISYQVAIKSVGSPNNDIMDYKDVGYVNRVTLKGLSLVSGQKYEVTVRGVDAFGSQQGLGRTSFIARFNEPVYVDTSAGNYFNAARAMYMCDTSTVAGAIQPKNFSGATTYFRFRVPVTIREPDVIDRCNAPCRVQFIISNVSQRPSSINEFRVADDQNNEVPRYLLPGCTTSNPDISFLVNIGKNKSRTYYIYWGSSGASNPSYGFFDNTNQLSVASWTPYYTRRLLPPGIEEVNMSLSNNLGYNSGIHFERTGQYLYFRDDARSDPFDLPFGFYYFGNNYTTWYVSTNGFIYRAEDLTKGYDYTNTFAEFTGATAGFSSLIAPLWIDLKYDNPNYPVNPGVYYNLLYNPYRYVFTWRTNRFSANDDIYIFQTVLYSTGDICHRYQYLSPRGVLGPGGTDRPVNTENTVGISNCNKINWLINTPLNIGINTNPSSFYQCMDAFRGYYTVGTIEAPDANNWANVAHYESMVFDSRVSRPNWSAISYNCNGGTNGRFVIQIRHGPTPIPDLYWTSWQTVATVQTSGSTALSNVNNRYFQYKVIFQRNGTTSLPVMNEVSLAVGTLKITKIESDFTEVSQGQEDIDVVATIYNTNNAAISLVNATLTFNIGKYEFLLKDDLPIWINSNSDIRISFKVNVLDNSPTGIDTIHGIATGVRGLITFRDDDADTPWKWRILQKSNLVIKQIDTTPAFVNKGQTNIPVRMVIENQGEVPMRFEGASLTFTLGKHTFQLQQPPVGTIVPAYSSIICTFTVNVLPDSESGVVIINGTASGTNILTGKVTDDTSADITDSWTIQNPAELVLYKVYTPSQVYRGQTNIPVRYEVLNLGEATARWNSTQMNFYFVPPPAIEKTYTATYAISLFPIDIVGGGAKIATYGVDISPLTATGTDIVDGAINYTDLNNLNISTYPNAIYPSSWTIIAEKVLTYKDSGYLYESNSFNRPQVGVRTVYAKGFDLAPLKEFVVRWYDPNMNQLEYSNPPLTSDASGSVYHSFNITPTMPYGLYRVRITDPLNTYVVCENQFSVVCPASLVVQLRLPNSVSVGQPFVATATFYNVGSAPIVTAYPSALLLSGTGNANILSGPNPAIQDIPGESHATFTWLLGAVSAGTLVASASGMGFDGNDNTFIKSATATSNLCIIQNPPNLQIVAVIATPTVVYRGQNNIEVVFSVVNTGSATAVIDAASLTFTIGSYTQIISSPTIPYNLLGNNTIATFIVYVNVATDSPTGDAIIRASLRAYDSNYPASVTYLAPPVPSDNWTVASIGIMLSANASYNPTQYSFNRGQTIYIRAFGLTPNTQWYRIRLFDYAIPGPNIPTSGWVNVSPALAADNNGYCDHLYLLPSTARLGTWTVSIENDPDNNGNTVTNPVLALQYPLIQVPGSLMGTFTLSPLEVFVGATVTINLTVSNNLSTAASTIYPATCSPIIKTFASTGDLSYVSGPIPSVVSVPAMGMATFTWLAKAIADTGLVGSFSMMSALSSAATGIDSNTQLSTSTPRLISNSIKIYRRALSLTPTSWYLGSYAPGETTASYTCTVSNAANATLTRVLWNKVDLNGPDYNRISKVYENIYPDPVGVINPGVSRQATTTIWIPYNQPPGLYIATMAVFEDLNNNQEIDIEEPYVRFNVSVEVATATNIFVIPSVVDMGFWPKGFITDARTISVFSAGNVDLLNVKLGQVAATLTALVNFDPETLGNIAVGATKNSNVSVDIPINHESGVFIATWVAWDDRDNSNTINATEAFRYFQIKIGIGNMSLSITPGEVAEIGAPNSVVDMPKIRLRNTGELPLTRLKVVYSDLIGINYNETIASSNILIPLPQTLEVGANVYVTPKVYIPAGTLSDEYRGEQVIYEDVNQNGTLDANEPRASVMIVVRVLEIQAIQVLVPVVDFGGLAPGTGRTIQIPCRNTGNVDLYDLRWEKVDLVRVGGGGIIPKSAYTFPPSEPFSASASNLFYRDISINIPAGTPVGVYEGNVAWLYNDNNRNASRDTAEPQDDFGIRVEVGIISLDIEQDEVLTSGDPANISLPGQFTVKNTGSLTVSNARATATSLIGPQTIPQNANFFSPNPIGTLIVGQRKSSNWYVSIPPATPPGVYLATLTVWDDSNNDGIIQAAEAIATASLKLTVNSKRVLKVFQNPLDFGVATEGSIVQKVIEIQNIGNVALNKVMSKGGILRYGLIDSIPEGNVSFNPQPIGALAIGESKLATVTIAVGMPRANGTYSGVFYVYEDYNPANNSFDQATEEHASYSVILRVGKKKITVDRTLVDLGSVNHGNAGTGTFNVINSGDFSLERVRWLAGPSEGPVIIPAHMHTFTPNDPFSIPYGSSRSAEASLLIATYTAPGVYIGTHTVYEDENNNSSYDAGEPYATFTTKIIVLATDGIRIEPVNRNYEITVDFGKVKQGMSTNWKEITFMNIGNTLLKNFYWNFSNIFLSDNSDYIRPENIEYQLIVQNNELYPGMIGTAVVRINVPISQKVGVYGPTSGQRIYASGSTTVSDVCMFKIEVIPKGPNFASGTVYQEISTSTFPAAPTESPERYFLSAWVCPATGSVRIGFAQVDEKGNVNNYDYAEIASTGKILYGGNNVINAGITDTVTVNTPYGLLTFYRLFIAIDYRFDQQLASSTVISITNSSPSELGSHSVFIDAVQFEKAVLKDQTLPTEYNNGIKIITPNRSLDVTGKKYYYQW